MFSSSSNEKLRRTSIDDNNDELWSVHNAEKAKIFSHNTKWNDKFRITAKFINKCTSFYFLNDINFNIDDDFADFVLQDFDNEDDRECSVTCDLCIRYVDIIKHNNLFKYFRRIVNNPLHLTRPYYTVISKCNLIIVMIMENEINKIKKLNKIKYQNSLILFQLVRLVRSRNALTQFYSSILIYRIRPLYFNLRIHCKHVQPRIESELNFEIYPIDSLSTLLIRPLNIFSLVGFLTGQINQPLKKLNPSNEKDENHEKHENAKFSTTSITCTASTPTPTTTTNSCMNKLFLVNLYIRLCFNFLRVYLLTENTNSKAAERNGREHSVPKSFVLSIDKFVIFLNFKYLYNQLNLFCLSFLNRCINFYNNHNLSTFLFKRPKSICLPIMYQNDHQSKKSNDKTNYQFLNSLKDYFKDKSIFFLLSDQANHIKSIAQRTVCVHLNEPSSIHSSTIDSSSLNESSNFKNYLNRNEFRQIDDHQLKGVKQLSKQTTLSYTDDVRWKQSKLESKFSYWFTVLIILLSLTCSVRGTANKRAAEKRILDSIIGQGKYDSRIRPSGVNNTLEKDGPCVVNVNIYVRSIGKISDLDMEYSIQITFREQWNDSRKPDLFFSNEKEGHFHNIIMPNVLLRIYPNGQVLYSIRISLVLTCPMNLKYYPLDKQVCQIKMASYGYTTEDLIFYWKKDNPVQVTNNLNLPTFSLANYRCDYCTSKTNTGEYSCIYVDLIFKREFSYYLIQIYIPNSMLVIVSWVSFWLDPSAIPARVSLGVTTLLTMATQISGINASLPPVSYTKAIDVWTGVCLTFVFGALIEFALVNYASRKDAIRKRKQDLQNAQLGQQNGRPVFQNPAVHNLIQNNQTGIGPLSGYGINNAIGPLGMTAANRITSNFVNQFSDGNKMKHHIIPPKMDFTDQNFYQNDRNAPVIMPINQRTNRNDLRSCEVHISADRGSNILSRWLNSFPNKSKKIDVISRIIFPTMFGMFNVVYWSTYLLRDDLKELTKK